jgi:hypothetical protein
MASSVRCQEIILSRIEEAGLRFAAPTKTDNLPNDRVPYAPIYPLADPEVYPPHMLVFRVPGAIPTPTLS